MSETERQPVGEGAALLTADGRPCICGRCNRPLRQGDKWFYMNAGYHAHDACPPDACPPTGDDMHPAMSKVAVAFEAESAAWTRNGNLETRVRIDGNAEIRHHGMGEPGVVIQLADLRDVARWLEGLAAFAEAGAQARRRAEQCNAIEDTTADLMRDRASRASTLDDNADVAPQYATLRRVLDHALEQASVGKGAARHAQPGVPFEEQPLVQICQWLGSNHFALGQAIKKLTESSRLPREAALREILGAINYAAAAFLVRERLP